MLTTLTIKSSTSSSKGGFINVYEGITEIETPLGTIVRPFGTRYQAKTTDQQEVGKIIEVDMSDFLIEEDKWTSTKDGKEYTTYWIKPKA